MKKLLKIIIIICIFLSLFGCKNQVDEIYIDNGRKNKIKSINISNSNMEETIDGWFNLPKYVVYSIKVSFSDSDDYWAFDYYKRGNDILESKFDHSIIQGDNEDIVNDKTTITFYKYIGDNKWKVYHMNEDYTWTLDEDTICYPLRDNSNEVIMSKKNTKFIDFDGTQMILGYGEVPIKISVMGKETYYYSKELGVNTRYYNDDYRWTLKMFNIGTKEYPYTLPKD